MVYQDIRSEIKNGDILAFSHKKWNSWRDFKSQMVRVFTRSEYSHVCTAWVVADRVFVIEAVVPEARIYPLSKLGDFYWIPMKAAWSKDTEEVAISHIGDKYSQLAAMKAYFVNLGKGNTQECAALTMLIASNDNINLGDRQTPDSVILSAQQMGNPVYYVTNK